MSTSAQVQAAWASSVFENAAITALTDKAFSYDTDAISEFEVSGTYFAQRVNFFEYLVTRKATFNTTHEVQYDFTVEVRYTKETDAAGSAWGEVRDGLETLFGVVQSSLGDTWQTTVDLWRPQDGEPTISQISIDETPCIRGIYRYVGTQHVTV